MHGRSNHIRNIPNIDDAIRTKRVAAYCRVSGDRNEAFHSLEAQMAYFQSTISLHPEWELVEVYSDRAVTGTRENREEFQKMLKACREGEIDIILCKSITRFARNSMTLLTVLRELTRLGVNVIFDEERIETLSAKGEFVISVLAARAQEESRSASLNQIWRIRKCYEKGIPVTGNCLGYRMVDHQFLIDEEEEALVRRIFDMYLSGMGVGTIAKRLTEEGVKTRRGFSCWSTHAVFTIIRNEKYVGDLLLQKKYIEDYMTKRTVENKGERQMYVVTDAHDAIIDRETFDRIQAEIRRRQEVYPSEKGADHYPFTGLIVCGQCGKRYNRAIAVCRDQTYRHPIWICPTFKRLGTKFCKSQRIPEKVLIETTCKVLGMEELDETVLRDNIREILVPGKNTLLFRFHDGTEKRVEWSNSRKDSWTPEMKAKASEKSREKWKERKAHAQADDKTP